MFLEVSAALDVNDAVLAKAILMSWQLQLTATDFRLQPTRRSSGRHTPMSDNAGDS
jgi:hypothetical protein